MTANPMDVVPISNPKIRVIIIPLKFLGTKVTRDFVANREAVAFRKQNDPLRGLGVPSHPPTIIPAFGQGFLLSSLPEPRLQPSRRLVQHGVGFGEAEADEAAFGAAPGRGA
jgi:hypothetical protein